MDLPADVRGGFICSPAGQQVRLRMPVGLVFAFLFFFGLHGMAQNQSQTFTTSGTFTVPAGVTSITVECWGGGGAGGGSKNNNSKGGGGGAGGAYAKKTISVVPGTNYTVRVGGQMNGTTGDGEQGNPSWFGTPTTVYAEGGAGGAAPNGGTAQGGKGSIGNSIGDVLYPGGDGADGSSSIGGGGGGGAGSNGAGGYASGIIGGTGTAIDGGNGGAGLSSEGNGNNGSIRGGGGGGAFIPDKSDHNGGNGAAGQVRISWIDYCAPTYSTGTSGGDYISLVRLGTIDNSTGGATSPPYYTYYNSISTNLVAGNSYTVTLSAGTWATWNNISVWIDFNQNYEFEPSEKLGNVTPGAAPATGTLNFTVPTGATLGNTRMRVREVWNQTNIDPCSSYQYGETEDYNIKIINSSPTITSFTPTSSCEGSSTSVVITGTNFTGATAVRFNGISATSYTVNSATQITATLPAGATTGAISVTTPAGTATSSSVFTVNDRPTVTATATATCLGGSTGTITASGSGGAGSLQYSLNGGTFQSSGTFTGLAAGSYTITVKDANGCTGSVVVTVPNPPTSSDSQSLAGTDSWIGHVYKRLDSSASAPSDGNAFTSYYGRITETELFDRDFGSSCISVVSGASTNYINPEYFAVRYRMNSSKVGIYLADIGSDDGARLTVDGTKIYDKWVERGYITDNKLLFQLTGSSNLMLEYYESTGGNRVSFQNFSKVYNTIATSDLSFCEGGTATTITGNNALTDTPISNDAGFGVSYQWQSSPDGANGWSDVNGATQKDFTPPTATSGTVYYRRVLTVAKTNPGSIAVTATDNNSGVVKVTVNPNAGTPTAITIAAGEEPSCQLTGGTLTTSYATTASNSTGFNWTVSDANAGTIDPVTGVMSWALGFTGQVEIRVTANGCNGPSATTTRTVTILPIPVTGDIYHLTNNP